MSVHPTPPSAYYHLETVLLGGVITLLDMERGEATLPAPVWLRSWCLRERDLLTLLQMTSLALPSTFHQNDLYPQIFQS